MIHEIPREVLRVRDAAMGDHLYQLRCIFGEKVYWVPTDRAYAPGQIYSNAGKDEYDISQCCEWHFDQLFKEDDEEN